MKTIIRPLDTLRTDLPEIFLPNGLATYSQNISYYYGELRKRYGLLSPTWQIGEPVQGIYCFRKFDDTIYWLALTPNELFLLNEDGTNNYLTPTYSEGTISISEPNLNIVNGTNTHFVTAGIKAGDKLALSQNENNPNATWYTIQEVNSETQLTLASNAQVYSGNYTIRQLFSAPSLYRWQGIVINDNFVFTNGYNPVMKYDGGGNSQVLLDEAYYYLVGFYGRLILGRKSDSPAYIQWSAPGDIGNFSDVGSGASYFKETGQPITGLGRVGFVLVIYQPDHIFTGIPTGNVEDPFTWNHAVVNNGLIAPYSLIEYRGYNFGLGRKDFFIFDGNSYTPIGQEIIKFFKEVTSFEEQQKVIAFGDNYECIHFLANTNLGRLDFKYNLRFERWSIDSYNPEIISGGILE